MDAIDLPLIPCISDWQRYHSPTVLRRQGHLFLEQRWKTNLQCPESYAPSQQELSLLAESYGGVCVLSANQILLLFNDCHWARRCEAQLIKLGLSTQRWGCHIQLEQH